MAQRDLWRRAAPDPARAHGAWVYLAVSIAAGALAAGARGAVAAISAGLAFVGVFLVASALAIHPRPWKRRFALGAGMALGASATGVALADDPTFLAYASIAMFPAAASVWFAARGGVLAPPALAFGVLALVVSAPATACAGGASPLLGLALFAWLAPFFVWRTLKVRTRMAAGEPLSRRALKRIGLKEATLALGWTFGGVALVHVLAGA